MWTLRLPRAIARRARRKYLHIRGVKLVETSTIERWRSLGDFRLIVGDNVYINQGLHIDGSEAVYIGSNVRIGPYVTILTSTHHITEDSRSRASHAVVGCSVTIEDGVWLGASSMILPGVVVREGCVVAASAVVTRSTEPNGVYAGVPARRIRDL